LGVDSYWSSFFGVTPQVYSLPRDDKQCLE
jgi:hypothetical protein